MDSIKVSYKIWDDIKAKYSENHFFVIGYDYVESRWVRYICADGSDKWRQYFYEYEIEWKSKDITLWFTNKDG